MPVMDRLEATQEIRRIEQKKGQHIPIIALTAHAFDKEQQFIMDSGSDAPGHTKPCGHRKLKI